MSAAPFRVLTANFRWFGGFGEAVVDGLHAAGATVDDFVGRDYSGLALRRWIERGAERGPRVPAALLRRLLALDFAARQEALLRRAERMRPDLLLVIDEDQVAEETLVEIGRRTGAARALWIADDPFAKRILPDALSAYDFLFVFDRHYMAPVKERTPAVVSYLPLAGDDRVFGPPRVPFPHPARFGAVHVGSFYPERAALLAAAGLSDLEIYGWPRRGTPPALAPSVRPGRISRPAANRLYARAWVVLSLHHLQVRRAPTRVFDPALAGAFQITEARHDLAELLTPDLEIVTAESSLELKEKLAFYREKPEARARIAAAGAARVAADHTFRHRIAHLLAVVRAGGAR